MKKFKFPLFFFGFIIFGIFIASKGVSAGIVTERIYSKFDKDGTVYQSDYSWDNVRYSDWGYVNRYELSSLAGKNYYGMFSINRSFVSFDTSNIPLDSKILNAQINIFPYSKKNAMNDGLDWLTIVMPSNDYSEDREMTDFDKCGAIDSPVEGVDSRVDITSIATGTYLSFVLNSEGISWINKNGDTSFCFREGHDVMDVPYPGDRLSSNSITSYTSLVDGDSTPYLEITYSLPDENDPVILIPGLVGSWEKDGEWIVDPILHTYDGLVEALGYFGYEQGDNLELFAYDWRRDNYLTSVDLSRRIDEVKERTGAEKVDLVAHSMGGLVARQYVASQNFSNDIDDLIFLGTPHKGAPESYLAYYYGQMPGMSGGIMGYHVKSSAHHDGYGNFLEYIKDEYISVGQLLPIYDYLFQKKWKDGIKILSYPSSYPVNNFLEHLNKEDELSDLESSVDVHNIYSYKKGPEDETTISLIRKKPLPSKKEERSKLRLYEKYWAFLKEIKKGAGDGTVPQNSLSAVSGLEPDTILLNTSHREIVTEAQQTVIEILTGERPGEIKKPSVWPIDSTLLVGAFSPIDILVIDPNGKRIGQVEGDELSELAGGFYSGADSENELVTTPNPKEGSYRILIRGTGAGYYRLMLDVLSDESEAEEKYFAGYIKDGQEEEFIFEIKDGKIKPEAKQGKLLSDLVLLNDNQEIKKKNLFKQLEKRYKVISQLNSKNSNCFFKNNKWKTVHLKLELARLEKYVTKKWISNDAYWLLRYDIEALLGQMSV